MARGDQEFIVGKPQWSLWMWDMFDGWLEILGPADWDIVEKVFNKKTAHGQKNVRYSDGDYYSIKPAGIKMVVDAEWLGR